MAFVDELNARYGEQNVKRLSQFDDTDTATVNTTAIAAVLVDVEGWFRTRVGVEYDSTDDRMLGLACDVGILLLRRRAGEHGDFTELWADIAERALALRKVTHSDTVVATKVLANKMAETATDRSYFNSGTLFNKGFPPLTAPTNANYYSLDPEHT